MYGTAVLLPGPFGISNQALCSFHASLGLALKKQLDFDGSEFQALG